MVNEEKDLHKYHIIICAVLFGCDDSFIGLDLGQGIMISRKSLHPNDHLDAIFELDAMSLRREYESARLNNNTLDVACVYKEYDFFCTAEFVKTYFDRICDKMLVDIDNKVRAIRLLIEGPVRFKKLAIKMNYEPYLINETKVSYGHNEIISIGEAFHVKTISKAHCNDIDSLLVQINSITFPMQKYLQQCHILYDRSYLVTLQEAEVLLITCLEILFLKSEKSKKIVLAKRCATFLFDSKEERLICYEKLHEEYKNRSDFVHEGSVNKISAGGIIFLRDCVRKCLLRLINSPIEKTDLIKNLKSKIEKICYWPSQK